MKIPSTETDIDREIRDPMTWTPMPLDGLPHELREYIEVKAEETCNDLSTVGITLFASASASIGNSRRIKLKKGWVQPAILHVAIVADSGDGKSPAFDAGVSLAREAFNRRNKEDDQVYNDQKRDIEERNRIAAENDQELEAIPDRKRPRFDLGIATTQKIGQMLAKHPRGLFLIKDELSGLFGSFNQFNGGNGSDAAFFLEIHNGSQLPIDKIGNMAMDDDEKEMVIERPFLAIAGGIQWSKLKKFKTEEHEDSGLFARFLFAAPPSQDWKWREPESSEDNIEKCIKIFDRLFDLKGCDDGSPAIVELSSAAKAALIPFTEEIEVLKKNALTKGERLAWPKIRTAVGRIALIVHQLHVAAGTSGVNDFIVDEATMKYAIKLCRWFGAQAQAVYAKLQLSAVDDYETRVIGFVGKRASPVTPSQLMSSGPSPRCKTAAQALSVLDSLAGRGLLRRPDLRRAAFVPAIAA